MKNEKLWRRFQCAFKTPPQPFVIFKLPASLSLCTILFYPLQSRHSHHHRHSSLSLAPRTTPIQNPPPTAVTTIIHFSFFIIHHSLSSPPTPPFPPSLLLRTRSRPALSKIEIRAIGATTILHSSLFIFHHSFSLIAANPTIAATLHYPSPRTIKNRNSRRR